MLAAGRQTPVGFRPRSPCPSSQSTARRRSRRAPGIALKNPPKRPQSRSKRQILWSDRTSRRHRCKALVVAKGSSLIGAQVSAPSSAAMTHGYARCDVHTGFNLDALERMATHGKLHYGWHPLSKPDLEVGLPGSQTSQEINWKTEGRLEIDSSATRHRQFPPAVRPVNDRCSVDAQSMSRPVNNGLSKSTSRPR